MDLHTPIGTPIIFTGEGGEGVEAILAQHMLVPGQTYTLAGVNFVTREIQVQEVENDWYCYTMFKNC